MDIKKADLAGPGIGNYSDLEKIVISPDAYGYLIHLIKLGVLSDNDVESVVECAASFGKDDLSIEDLKSIVASVLFNRDTNSPFNNSMLNGGDIPIQ